MSDYSPTILATIALMGIAYMPIRIVAPRIHIQIRLVTLFFLCIVTFSCRV